MGSLKGTVGFGVRVPLTLRLSLVFRAFCGMHACVCVCVPRISRCVVDLCCYVQGAFRVLGHPRPEGVE